MNRGKKMCHLNLFFVMKKNKKKWGGICKVFLIIMIGIMCLPFFPLSSVKAETLSLRELVAKIQERYEKTTDLKAKFSQEMTIRAMKKTEKEDGVVYIKNPRRMLWHYVRPKIKKLVINPQQAWLYIPDDKVAYVQDAGVVLKSKLTLKFLSGMGNLQEDFNIAFSEGEHIDSEGNYLITLIPKVADFGVDKLLISVNRDTFLIAQIGFSDLYGNITRIRFTDVHTDVKLPDSLFEFTPPKGFEIFSVP